MPKDILDGLANFSDAGRELSLRGELVDCAKDYLRRPLNYQWTLLEKEVLDKFFTNTDRRVFFIFRLLSTLGGALFTMCGQSRNKRGIRGTFVDDFLTLLLSAKVEECAKDFGGNGKSFLARKNLTSLDKFVSYSEDTKKAFTEFIASIGDPSFIRSLLKSSSVKELLLRNQLTGTFLVGFEQISILTAMTLQLLKPGFGSEAPDSQLSHHYVEEDISDHYPIEDQLQLLGLETVQAKSYLDKLFGWYGKWRGENFDGPLPKFFRQQYCHLVNKNELERGVVGETCDVLGSFAPACILTSVGTAINERDLSDLFWYLLNDKTPENIAIVDYLRTEALQAGYDFSRHINMSPWRQFQSQYLLDSAFETRHDLQYNLSHLTEDNYRVLNDLFTSQGVGGWEKSLLALTEERQIDDSLPDPFKVVPFSAFRKISFRCWCGLQKWQFTMKQRTILSPKFGFYSHNKPIPEKLEDDFLEAHNASVEIWRLMDDKKIPPRLRQYLMPMGLKVGCHFHASIWLWESIINQGTRFNNLHEVRQFLLGCHNSIGDRFPALRKLFRADLNRNYIFAHLEEPVLLPDLNKKKVDEVKE